MKNKKIISLLCALAMLFSMFSAFTVANAADKGLALAGSLSKDGTKITIEASVVQPEGGLKAFTVKFNVPEGVTNANAVFTPTDPTVALTTNIVNGVAGVSWAGSSAVEFKDNKLFTAVLTLDSPLAADYTATLQNDSSLKDTAGEIFCPDDMEATTTTVQKWQDPNKKPDTVARPDENTDPDPVEPDKPTPIDPVGKGIALKANIDKTNTKITVEASVTQPEGGLKAFTVKFNVPEGVTNANAVFTPTDPTVALTTNIVNGVAGVSWAGSSAVEFKDNKLFTAELTLPTPLTEALELKLQNDSSLKDTAGEIFCPDDITASSAVVEPAGGSEVKPVKTANLKDYVGAGAADAAKTAQEAEKTVYLTVDVKKADGSAAVYGTDFDAEYPVGTKLTKKAYENLIHGYTADTDMAAVINNLKFNIYNNDVKTISSTLNAVGDETQLVDPVTDKTIGNTKPTPTPKVTELTLKPSLSVKSFYVNTLAKVNVDITSGDDYKVEDGDTVEFVMSDSNKYIDFVTDNDPVKDEVAKTKALTKTINNTKNDAASTSINIQALSATGTAKITVNFYKGDIEEDEKPVATKDLSVKVIKKDIAPGGGDDDDDDDSNSSGSSIAGWNPNQSLGTLGQFTDIGSVDWAKKAITTLALKGIVSGDGNGLFRPNDNITRAEYCQILIGAINKTNEYADSSFADVPSDAWFYHAVSVASANGIVSGYGDGNFGPYDLITRQDMALMTYKAAQVMNKNMSATRTTSFADAGAISDYAATAVQTLADAGIINGVSDTEFAPIANATRAQAAKILYDTFLN